MSAIAAGIIPYCGAPPSPASLAFRWNLDPALLGFLLAALALHLGGAGRRLPRWRLWAYLAGWGVGSLALISPLCALSVSLFSARVGQHMILMMVAAPLVACGLPARSFARVFRQDPAKAGPSRATAAATAFAVALWFWHAPGPYAATFLSTLVYWLMHISLFGSALWLWCELLNRPVSGAAVAASALSMMQMGFLGALITLAPRAMYTPHLGLTALWGVTPLQDQQLGGAIMWAPGTVTFLAALTAFGWRLLRPALSPPVAELPSRA